MRGPPQACRLRHRRGLEDRRSSAEARTAWPPPWRRIARWQSPARLGRAGAAAPGPRPRSPSHRWWRRAAWMPASRRGTACPCRHPLCCWPWAGPLIFRDAKPRGYAASGKRNRANASFCSATARLAVRSCRDGIDQGKHFFQPRGVGNLGPDGTQRLQALCDRLGQAEMRRARGPPRPGPACASARHRLSQFAATSG